MLGSNILKRAIEHMSAGPFDEPREQAMDILNEAIETCFNEEASNLTTCPFCLTRHELDTDGYLPPHIGVDNKPCINAR